MQQHPAEPRRASRAARSSYWPVTNFYPQYDGANDQVDRVTAVRAIRFQPILPRYKLSTSETRDEGVGPMFDVGAPAGPSRPPRRKVPTARPRSVAGLPPWKGSRVDLLA